MNKSLSKIAIEALTASWAEKGDGYCQRWTRQVIQKLYGSKFNRFHLSSAKLSALEWLESPYGFRYKSGMELQDGDILYKTVGSGGFGHVGIFVEGRGVAENSSYHGSSDARGIRTRKQWGHINVVVRLPDPNTQTVKPTPAEVKPTIVVSVTEDGKTTNTRIPIHKEPGVNFAPVQTLLQLAKVPYELSEWGDGTPNIRIVK